MRAQGLTEQQRATLDDLAKKPTLTDFDRGSLAALRRSTVTEDERAAVDAVATKGKS